jgi:hypothetical protein
MPIPPKSVQEVARRALERRRKAPKSKKGGTMVGVSRGRDLARGANISMRSIRRMVSFFARHDTPAERRNRKEKISRASISWDLWGGNPGRRWAESIVRRLKNA